MLSKAPLGSGPGHRVCGGWGRLPCGPDRVILLMRQVTRLSRESSGNATCPDGDDETCRISPWRSEGQVARRVLEWEQGSGSSILTQGDPGSVPYPLCPGLGKTQERAGLHLLSLPPLCPLPRAPTQGTPGSQGFTTGGPGGQGGASEGRRLSDSPTKYLVLCRLLGRTLGRGGRPVPVSNLERGELIESLVFWGRSSGLQSQGGATKEAGLGEAEGGRAGSASAVALPVHGTEGTVPVSPHPPPRGCRHAW